MSSTRRWSWRSWQPPQHLGANQRAVLMLREVLGFSAKETADMLDTSVPSVNSALQRARAAVAERVPKRTQQSTLRSLGDDGVRRLIDRYVDAWERCDVRAFTGLLVEDATFAMPPLATWYTPRDTIATWASNYSMSGEWRWRGVLTSANAQPALAFYAWDEPEGAYLPFALNVLSLRDGGLVSDVTAFIVRSTDAPEPEAYVNFPHPADGQAQLAVTFGRFGVRTGSTRRRGGQRVSDTAVAKASASVGTCSSVSASGGRILSTLRSGPVMPTSTPSFASGRGPPARAGRPAPVREVGDEFDPQARPTPRTSPIATSCRTCSCGKGVAQAGTRFTAPAPGRARPRSRRGPRGRRRHSPGLPPNVLNSVV